MTTAVDHRLLRLLVAAADSGPEPPGPVVEVLPRPDGPCAVVVVLPRRAVVAADVAHAWVLDRLPPGPVSGDEHHPVLGPLFLGALSGRLGVPPAGLSVLLAAAGRGPDPAGTGLSPMPGLGLGWAEYRHDVRTWCARRDGVTGLVSVGRGPAGRYDVQVLVPDGAGVEAAAALLDVARTLVPHREPLFLSLPPHGGGQLVAACRAGYRPIGAEVLFADDPEAPPKGAG